MKTNVYIFSEKSPAKEYGIGTYISQVHKCFEKDDRLNLITIELSASLPEVHWDEDLNTLYIPSSKLYSNYKPWYYSGVMRILRLYFEVNTNCIFIINFFSHSGLIPLIKKYFTKGKIILIVHYMDWTFHIQGNIKRFKDIIKHSLSELGSQTDKLVYESYMREKSTLGKVDHVVCLSNFTAKLLTDSYNINSNKISVIHNGAEDYTDIVLKSKRELKRVLHIPSREKIILYVGRLHDDKGSKELVQAFRVVLKDYPCCRLIVVGNGHIESFHSESKGIWYNITYTGRLEKDQLFQFYKIADIGVLPSFNEQCSYVVIEMMMFSLPVIGTDSTGLSEMIEDGKNGYKVKRIETEDGVVLPYADLANHIIKVLKSKQLGFFKRYSRCMYLKKYSLTEMHNKLRALILYQIMCTIILIVGSFILYWG